MAQESFTKMKRKNNEIKQSHYITIEKNVMK